MNLDKRTREPNAKCPDCGEMFRKSETSKLLRCKKCRVGRVGRPRNPNSRYSMVCPYCGNSKGAPSRSCRDCKNEALEIGYSAMPLGDGSPTPPHVR